MEINQYPLESFAFQDNDYYDIDFWTGTGYQTKKILGSVIKAGILAAVENIYTASGVITGDRQIGLGGNNLNFLSSDAGASFTINLNDLGTTSNSQFLQTLSQIYLSIVDVTTPDKDVQFDINTINTQLVLNDGLNFTSLQITNVGSALNFTDGISNYRVEANENGVVINNLYLLPATDGTAGQVMTTDGFGNVNWQDSATTIISWGDIVGTLSDQTDLQTALDAKLNDPEGVASQYIRGDGTLADFPTLTGGGSAVSLYLNGGVSQGTILGGQYYQLSNIANLGPSADFILNADGLIAQFITDVNEPNVINIPAGNWHTEFYFSASSGGGTPNFYVEIYKYDGTAFTLLGSNSTNPENIVGSAVDLYYTAIAIPETTLTPTDRIAIRVFVSHAGRIITLHTQDNNLSEVVTTISTGLTALNGLTDQVQYFQAGTSGTNFNITSSGDTHTFNIPTASATNRGVLSSADWSTFNLKANTASPAFTGTPTAPTAATGTNTTQVASTAFVQDAINKQPEVIQVAASDEITALTVGTGKTTFRMPFGMTLTGVRASLTTAQTSGTIFTVDIIVNGVSALSTKLTIDNTEKTSTTAVTPAVITTSALADDAEIRIDITQIGDGTAKGLKVTLLGTRA